MVRLEKVGDVLFQALLLDDIQLNFDKIIAMEITIFIGK